MNSQDPRLKGIRAKCDKQMKFIAKLNKKLVSIENQTLKLKRKIQRAKIKGYSCKL